MGPRVDVRTNIVLSWYEGFADISIGDAEAFDRRVEHGEFSSPIGWCLSWVAHPLLSLRGTRNAGRSAKPEVPSTKFNIAAADQVARTNWASKFGGPMPR